MLDPKAIFLVVDDFEPMRKVTVNQLRNLGAANVLTAMNGAEALRMLKAQRVDMVLSDWNMPLMSGLELLQAMRGDPALETIPFIMITAEAERSQVREAIASGVTDLLLKPYTPNRLVSQIERAFANRGRQRAPRSMAPEADPVLAPAARTVTAELPSILIVDDAPDNLMLLSHLFKDSYRIRLAQNGAKAIALCQSDQPPDLVLLDIMMPDMDGFEVTQRLREHPASENIPVIFVTAMREEEGRSRGLSLGAVDYVTKPIDPDTLQLRVRNFMRYVNVQRQLQASYDDMLEMSRLREDVEHIARHDIKGPLAGALGILQGIIAEKCEHEKELQVVEQTIMQALNMINLSAELLKIERGDYRLAPVVVNLGRMLSRIVDTTQPVFADKGVRIVLETQAEVHVLGEATFCYSVFQNLIKNACEASPQGAQVSVRIAVGDEVMVHVKNHGAVPRAIRERFFDKFVTYGKSGGTGLGTYSAKLLTEAQNGHIDLQVSDADNTTQLSVRLPAA